MPVFSLIGMNSFGGTRPRCGWFQRTSAFKSDERRRVKTDYRLVVKFEFVPFDRESKVGLELQPRDRPICIFWSKIT